MWPPRSSRADTGRGLTELSGDGRMSGLDRLRWLARNGIRNVAGAFTRLPVERARPDAEARRLAPGWAGSPSRLVSDAVLRRELAGLFAGQPVDIVDIGCGRGGARLLLAAAGLTGSYLGIDIDDRFDRAACVPGLASRFVQGDAHVVELPAADLVVSFSALEHIPDDARLIARLDATLKPGGAQVHVVPGGWALLAYLWHGYRHYHRRALRRRFDMARTRIVAVGGLASLLLHIAMIAVPEILLGTSLRRRVPRLYGRLVAASLALDRLLPLAPTNYVVIARGASS